MRPALPPQQENRRLSHMSIKIVADSTCDIPADLIKKYDVTIVPVYINAGRESFREGVDITRERFYRQLPTFDPYPTTAAPAVGQFVDGDRGFEHCWCERKSCLCTSPAS